MSTFATSNTCFLTSLKTTRRIINPNNSLHFNPIFVKFPSSSSSSCFSGAGLVHVATERKNAASFAQAATFRELEGSVTKAQGFRFAIVVARFNEFVTRRLMEGAVVTFKKYSVIEDIDIRGDTSHYDAVVNSASSGVLSAGLNSGVPCVFGVLTCDDMDQAINRAGGKAGNKGDEAALIAIEMASLFDII